MVQISSYWNVLFIYNLIKLWLVKSFLKTFKIGLKIINVSFFFFTNYMIFTKHLCVPMAMNVNENLIIESFSINGI